MGLVTGGMATVAVKPAAYFFVLTNHRLILLGNHNGRVGQRVEGVLPRAQMHAGPLRTHLLTMSMDVSVDGAPAPYRFSWGRAQGALARQAAAAIAAPMVM
ncbi:hypothetical protein GCM10010218_59830 [Streptomyces mashuensis]|uniref:YokE-like PH domain-containing protein n=1 Tax=Streptomyces mashuensis TaxID=33904 RepID=A0A919B9U4_9ACTN|nr:hypothetical protein GCM10010218_59830 [Streptomyces mashuensis]